MATTSLSRNHVLVTSLTANLECPPYLDEQDIHVYKNSFPLSQPGQFDVSSNQVNFHPNITNGNVIDIIRQTPRDANTGSAQERDRKLLYLVQEAADALAVLGSMDDDSFLWAKNLEGDRAFTVFPDYGVEEDENSANPGGFRRARFRYQTSTVAPGGSEPSKSLGWYSCYLDNSATAPTVKHSIYGFSVLMRTNAGGSTTPPQAGVALQVQTEIANTQRFGKGEALVVVAQHQAGNPPNEDDPTKAGNGKLVGVQSSIFARGKDTGPGDSVGTINVGSFSNYSFAANSNGLYPGFCAFIAKSVDDGDPGTKGAGWYNGFVADRDSITARSFWHIGRFAVVPQDIPTSNPNAPLRTALLAIGHDAPEAPLHIKYPGVAEFRFEDTEVNTAAATLGNIKFYGKGNTTASAPTVEVARMTANLSDAAAGQESGRLVFRAMDAGTLNVTWNLGQGIYSQGAVSTDRGLHTVNVGAASGNSTHGYYVAGDKVVGVRRTGWSPPSGTASRASFNTATATTVQLAQALKALIEDLTAHGLIGA